MGVAGKKGEKYFGSNKKVQTIMKHEILEKVLDTSIGVANFRSRNSPETYTYIDLFAGSGGFNVDKVGIEGVIKHRDLWGSPLIALNSIAKFRNKKLSPKKLGHFRVILVEKDFRYASILNDIVNAHKKHYGLDWIDVEILEGEWSKHIGKLKEEMESSTWGFIFADPYSVELNYRELVELLKGVSKLKDVLLFLNFGYIRRFSDPLRKEALLSIAEAFGIPEEKINDFVTSPTDQKMDEILTLVFEHISSIKSRYITGASLPIQTIERGVVNQDYFFLIMGTDSIGVMDGFMEAYKKVSEKVLAECFSSDLKKHRDQQTLPFYRSEIEEAVIKALKECKEMKLNKFFSLLWRWRPTLWTSVRVRGVRTIPTVATVVSILNKLYSEGRLDYDMDEGMKKKVFYKKKSKRDGVKPGEVKKENVAKKITIKFLG